MVENQNLFDDFFGMGFGKAFKDIFGEGNPLCDPDPRRSGLMETFVQEVEKGDRVFLEEAVIRYQAEVNERIFDIPLVNAYVKASVFVENLPAGYDSLNRIKDPSPNHRQAMAILAYEMGKPHEVLRHLKGIEEKVTSARIIYSLSSYIEGDSSPSYHSEILGSLLESSDLANAIIGIIYFNSGDMQKAEEFFEKATRLSPKFEMHQLNLMRAKVRNGKVSEVYSGMNNFYVETGSRLSADEMMEELKKDSLQVPSLRMRNLFEVVKNLMD